MPGHDSRHQPQRRHHHRWHVGAYSLLKERALLSMADAPLFGVGLLFSFISAWLCIRWLLKFIATHSFVGFAYYRIAFGLVVLATAWSGTVKWAA